ncbi:MAG: gamma-glutamyltransferase family protein [Spirochaetota bacterium]
MPTRAAELRTLTTGPCKRGLFFFLLLILSGCRGGDVAHSAAAHWLALPAELQGEVQGMPPHWSVQGTGGAVSSANPLATAAGIEVLQSGGNAIDALLAVQWVLAVTEPQSSGLGGGGFLVYYDARSKMAYALDGREEQPAAAPADLFLDSNGNPLPFAERIAGARAVGVPGTVALMDYALRRFGSGKRSWQELFMRAIALAQHGIRVSPRLAQAMALSRDRLLKQNGDSSAYLRSREPYKVGEAFYQHDLAATLKRLSEKGATDFYTGSIATDILATVQLNSTYRSSMAAQDLSGYRVAERQVLRARVNSATLYSIGAPASGATVLKMLQAMRSAGQGDESLLLQALQSGKIAFAEREKTLEDPDFAAARVAGESPGEAHNTTHVSIIDAAGNAVSYTSSVETSLGSALEVRGRGFVLNNQLSDFATPPGKVNSVEPGRKIRRTALNEDARAPGGKRPRSSMSPLIMRFDSGRIVALGSPGGPTIVGTVALTAARVLAGQELQTAVNAPRALVMPHGKALIELPLRRNKLFLQALPRAGIQADLGRKVISLGSVQAVECTPLAQQAAGRPVSPENGQSMFCTAASDLRREGLGLVPQIKVE